MEVFTIDDSDLLTTDEEENSLSNNGIPIYKILFILMVCILVFYAASVLVCVTNDECHMNVPDFHNLLNSTISTPYLVTGINSVIGLHIVTVTAFYYKTQSLVQLIMALAMYIAIGLVFFIFPFSSYNNYASIAVSISTIAWMVVVLFVLQRQRNFGRIPFYAQCLLFIVYTALNITYIALKFAFYYGGGHIALLLVELMAVFIMACFIIIIIYFIGKKTKLYIK